MKELLKEIKFIYVFAILIFLAMVLFYFMPKDAEVSLAVSNAIVVAFGTIIGYIFGKSRPDDEKKIE